MEMTFELKRQILPELSKRLTDKFFGKSIRLINTSSELLKILRTEYNFSDDEIEDFFKGTECLIASKRDTDSLTSYTLFQIITPISPSYN